MQSSWETKSFPSLMVDRPWRTDDDVALLGEEFCAADDDPLPPTQRVEVRSKHHGRGPTARTPTAHSQAGSGSREFRSAAAIVHSAYCSHGGPIRAKAHTRETERRQRTGNTAVMLPPRAIRILQVITDTDRRGAQVFASDLGAAMPHEADVRTVALASGTRQPPLTFDVLGRRSRSLRALRALRALMKTRDVTVAHGSSTLLACSLAGLGRKRPFVYRQISDSRFWARSWHRRLRVRLYLRRPAHIVALSASAAATLTDYLGVPPARITVIPNGVPAAGLTPADPERVVACRTKLSLPLESFLALYVGALVPEKGVDVAIRAVGATPGTHLAVVGDGPQRPDLQRLADEHAPGQVTFLGGLDDVSPAYGAADALILTSKGGDSMPAVLIEAGFCGLPTITCPVGAITDVVLDGDTGIVVPSDDVGATAGALEHLATDPARAKQMGGRAREHCLANFEIGVIAGQWTDVLQQVVRRGRRHP